MSVLHWERQHAVQRHAIDVEGGNARVCGQHYGPNGRYSHGRSLDELAQQVDQERFARPSTSGNKPVQRGRIRGSDVIL